MPFLSLYPKRTGVLRSEAAYPAQAADPINTGANPLVRYALRMYALRVSGANTSTTAMEPMRESQKSLPIVPWLKS